ncbi:MAG: hypothetical protein HY607_09700 [Planctomycetes bacterium]|uniref:hypothetical protein n=1 Tax=Candidatus Wunengus californicus TaxID=3367619 RepID=UPI0040263167|nr:hypothetical protein [Planctomycetota bacterium]MBI4222942.1 hypothetical protein [Planctomycetota bacterium]
MGDIEDVDELVNFRCFLHHLGKHRKVAPISRATIAAVDGHGTRDRPAGCTGLSWNHS